MWGAFIKAVVTGKHRLSPWSYVMAVVTVVYAIWPLDAIPDYITGPFGFIDDLGMWGVLLAVLRWELGRFERGRNPSSVTVDGTATTDAG